MKSCPNCGHKLGFFTYLTRYNSDSLIKHAKTAHKREHECLNCKHKLWIYYNPFRFKNLLLQTITGAVLLSWGISFVFVRPALGLDYTNAVLFAFILLCITLPAALSISKYSSASFKEEH